MSDTDARTSPDFHLDIEHLDGSATIRLGGDLDARAAPAVREELWPLLARYEAEMVTIDAGRLRSVDADGLAVLTGFARAMAPGRPAVRGLPADLRELLAGAGCFQLG